MKKNEKLSSLLYDEVGKIIVILKDDHSDTESIGKIGISTEIIKKINQAIIFRNMDNTLDVCSFVLDKQISYEELNEEHALDDNKDIYDYFYNLEHSLALDSQFEKAGWEQGPLQKNPWIISIWFYIPNPQEKIISLKIKNGLKNALFYLHYDYPSAIKFQTLYNLKDSLGVEFMEIV